MSYIALATTTLGSAASSVTFSSIPASVNGVALRDLVFVMSAATSANSNNRLRFNADSGSNYAYVYMLGPLQSSSGTTSGILIDWDAFTTTTLGVTNHITQIFDYSATDKHKTVLSRANRSDATVDALATRWANNNAITTIELTSRGGANFSTGSRISLYGIAG
jgi:hypothetical protein